MRDILLMQIRHRTHNLLENYPPHILTHLPPRLILQIMEHRLGPYILHYQHNLALTVNGVQ